MRYLDWGGDGPPVLALHGLASSAHWYDLVAPTLRENYRIVAPDQRGHGKTTQAERGYDWPTLASDAVGLMDRVAPGGFVVLGHSWGGNVAINLAALHPDRVSALVLIEGGIVAGPSRSAPTWEGFIKRLAPRNVTGTRRDFLDRIGSQLNMCWNARHPSPRQPGAGHLADVAPTGHRRLAADLLPHADCGSGPDPGPCRQRTAP